MHIFITGGTGRNGKLTIRAAQTRNGPVELLVDGETIGTVDRDAEDGEVAYHVTISVLSEDLLPH